MNKQEIAENVKQASLERISEKLTLQEKNNLNGALRHGAHSSSHGSSKAGGGYSSKGTHGNRAH